MVTRPTRRVLTAVIAVALMLALPAAARAAEPAAVTITACKLDGLTLTGRVALSGSSARKARGANLQLRFHALPLFGLPRTGEWRDLGRKTKVSVQESFSGLGADGWVGVLSWRFKKGRRTLLSGSERSQPLKVGRSKGRANCTLSEGLKPLDLVPPKLYILPVDEIWHRAPAAVQLFATDDFSGVAGMRYSVDGGPPTSIANSGTLTIGTEGAHRLEWTATDVAGNSATQTATIRVDAHAPTKPVIVRPTAITASRTPTLQWEASTDSGSGMRGYFVALRRADGSLVSLQPVDANTTSFVSPAVLEDGTYTAVITAVDNTDEAFAADSDPFTFRVDGTLEISAAPANRSILSGSAASGNFTLTLDRPANPASVNVALRNLSTDSPVALRSAGCANSPCTTITVDPEPEPLPEGRYALSVSGLKSDEGAAFPDTTFNYSVAFPNADGDSLSAESTGSGPLCASGTATSSGHAVTSVASGEQAVVDFDWSSNGSGAWKLEALFNGQRAGGQSEAGGTGAGNGRVRLGPFTMETGTLTFRLTVACPATSVTLTNMVGGRLP